MEIKHLASRHRFETIVDNHLAYVEYVIDASDLNIIHTVVPKEIGGKGIASALVAAAYEYGESMNLSPKATCSYAAVWLERKRG